MNSVLSLIGRKKELFENDIFKNEETLSNIIKNSSFLVLGAAGSIGQSVTKEIFKRNPKKLHAIDLSENNLAELVRDLRSSIGYISGEFKTFALDIFSDEYDAFMKHDGKYDYVLNLSAIKHVRSEEDPFTLMRMIRVNILNTNKTIEQAIMSNTKKYFCVSTDKAANPVNLMGASKRIMEMFIMRDSNKINISTARFANVAFSDGSLLHSFNQRIQKNQPIVAPNDIKRYFVTPKESGELCLMSCIFGENKDIFFPKLNESLHLISFSDIAIRYLKQLGYEPYFCETEEEARMLSQEIQKNGQWPCFFSKSNTTGEKEYEEFFTKDEEINLERFTNIGVIKNNLSFAEKELDYFEKSVMQMLSNNQWKKDDIVKLFHDLIPNFNHLEKGKYLDSKM